MEKFFNTRISTFFFVLFLLFFSLNSNAQNIDPFDDDGIGNSDGKIKIECFTCDRNKGKFCDSCENNEEKYFKGLLIQNTITNSTDEIYAPFSIKKQGRTHIVLEGSRKNKVVIKVRNTGYTSQKAAINDLRKCMCWGEGGGLDFSSLTTDQCFDILSCLDFSSLSAQQSSDILSTIDFANMTQDQCDDILACMNFGNLSAQQRMELLQSVDFSGLTDTQCESIASCIVSSDPNNGLSIGTDGKLNVNPSTLETITPKTIGGVVYPVGTPLDAIIDAMIAESLLDHMNKDQSMDNGSRLHFVNGRLEYRGTITGAEGFDIRSANGTLMFSVDF